MNKGNLKNKFIIIYFLILVLLTAGIIFAGFAGLISFLTIVCYVFLIRYGARRKLGGVTGDILGFICESSEALTLIMLAAML